MMLTGSATLTIGLFGGTSIYLYIGCLLLMSFSGTLFHPSAMSTISDRFQRGRPKAFSMFAMGGQAGFGTGPLTVAILLWLGGGVLENWQLAYLLWSIPILGMSMIMTITHIKDSTIGVSTEAKVETKRKVEGTTHAPTSTAKVLLPTASLLLLVIMLLRGFGRNLYEKFSVAFLVDTKQFNETTAAFYLSLITLIGLPGTILGGLWGDRIGEKQILTVAYILATLGLTLLFLLQSPILLLIALFILAIGSNAAMPNISSLTAKIVPIRARGKAYGLSFFFPIALGSVAPAVAALIIEYRGYDLIFLSAIGLYALATLVTFFVSVPSSQVADSTAK
jgi:FSR family fosmidomycin resistance protein-like MFS transporter